MAWEFLNIGLAVSFDFNNCFFSRLSNNDCEIYRIKLHSAHYLEVWKKTDLLPQLSNTYSVQYNAGSFPIQFASSTFPVNNPYIRSLARNSAGKIKMS